MKSEALRQIRTMRGEEQNINIKTIRDIKTPNQLSKTEEELNALNTITDNRTLARLERTLEREHTRFRKQDLAVEKSQANLLRMRRKLRDMVNVNRRIMEVRHTLQKSRYPKDPTRPITPVKRVNELKVKY